MTMIFHRSWIGLVVATTLAGCGPSRPAAKPDPDYPAALQALLDSTVAATPSIPGLALRVEAPGLGLAWSGAAGVADRRTGEQLTAAHTFRMASNTKTYVAAAILRLVEDGAIGLADPIAQRLSTESATVLRKGGYDPGAITVRDLLQHRSGIYDYAMDPGFATAAFSDPGHRWTRAEQLSFAMTRGKPYGKPGTVYHYSDTGYILLGEILERVTGKPLGAAVASLVGFDRLGLATTWFETLDSVPAGAGPRAHQYADTLDINPIDPSFDLYGGGGLVADIDDLAGFYRELLAGRVFKEPATLDSMLAVTAESIGSDSTRGYGMGIGRRRYGDVVCWGHGGYWGSIALSCPAEGLTMALSMNRSPDETFDPGSVVAKVVALLGPSLAAETR